MLFFALLPVALALDAGAQLGFLAQSRQCCAVVVLEKYRSMQNADAAFDCFSANQDFTFYPYRRQMNGSTQKRSKAYTYKYSSSKPRSLPVQFAGTAPIYEPVTVSPKGVGAPAPWQTCQLQSCPDGFEEASTLFCGEAGKSSCTTLKSRSGESSRGFLKGYFVACQQKLQILEATWMCPDNLYKC